MHELVMVEAPWSVPDPASHALVAGVSAAVVVLVILAVRDRRRALARARLADDVRADTRGLTAGPAIVRGKVELALAQDAAIIVQIEQRGSESLGSDRVAPAHAWTEVERTTIANPFYLRLESGERVRVEPGPDVRLIDELDLMQWDDRTSRLRAAELSEGEEPFVEGVLHRGEDPELRADGGYRDASAGEGWVLRPRPGSPMLVSTLPLSEPHYERAKSMSAAAWWIGIVFAFSQFGLVTYYVRGVAGVLRVAVVEDVTSSRDVRNRSSVQIRFDDGETWSAEIDAHPNTPVRVGHIVPVWWVARHPDASMIGGNGLGPIATAILLAGLLGAVLETRRRRRVGPWYMAKLVERGVGRLPSPPHRDDW